MRALPKPDPEDPTHQDVARLSPAGWGWFVGRGTYSWPPHVEAADDACLAAIQTGGRVLLEEPPRHGKTLYLQHLVAWFLGHHPDRKVIYAAHTRSLTERFGAGVRRALEEHGPAIFGIRVADDTRAKADFVVEPGGGEFFGIGTGGAVHGRGANLLVTDDLVPHAEAARSDVQMGAIEDFLRTDLLSRRERGFVHVGIQTRWSDDDPHGILLRLYPDLYRVLRFPAIAEEDDPLGRRPGEALWPEEHPLEELLETQRGMHPHRWSALYQQRPTPPEGGIWKRAWWEGRTWALVDGADGTPAIRLSTGAMTMLRDCWRFVVVDLATTEGKASDYTAVLACALVPQAPRPLVLLDLERRRMEGPEIIPAVARMRARWGASVVYMERVGMQEMALQYARRAGLPVRSIGRAKADDVRISGDKSAVAYEASPLAASGRLYLPETAPWLPEWEHEMLMLGSPQAHDDCADVTGWACHVALQQDRQGSLVLSSAREERRDPDEEEDSPREARSWEDLAPRTEGAPWGA